MLCAHPDKRYALLKPSLLTCQRERDVKELALRVVERAKLAERLERELRDAQSDLDAVRRTTCGSSLTLQTQAALASVDLSALAPPDPHATALLQRNGLIDATD